MATTTFLTNGCSKLVASLIMLLVEYSRDEIKTTLGDSTNNNRTLTVNQVIRFLTTRRDVDVKELGYNLQVAYDTVYYKVLNSRKSRRTDAIDINEFLTFFTHYTIPATTIYGQRLVRSLGQQLTI